MLRSITLRVRLAILIIVLVIGVSVMLGWVTSREVERQVRQDIGESLAEGAYHMADKLSRTIKGRINEVRLMLGVRDLTDEIDPDRLRVQLERLQNGFDVVSWIGLISPQGKVVASTGGILEGADVAHRPVFMNGRSEMWIGDVHEAVMLASLLPNPTGEVIKFVDIAAPVIRSDGSFGGVLGVHISWEWANRIRSSMFAPEEDRQELEFFIVAADGTVLLGPSEMIGQSLSELDIRAGLKGDRPVWSVMRWSDGRDYLTGHAVSADNFSGLGWTVLSRKPVERAFALIAQVRFQIAVMGAILACTFALLGWFLAGLMTEPLRRLAQAVDGIGEKDRAENIPLELGSPEMARLSYSLRRMLDRILSQDRTIGELKDIMHTDPLTGLPNRAFLEQHLLHAVPDSERSGKALAFMFMDLDGFKAVNDTLGHHAGDILLIEVADRIRTCLRGGDIAIRQGGDEFVLVLKSEPDAIENLARTVSARLIAAIREPVSLPEGGSARVGCSIGVSLWPRQGDRIDTVLHQADSALYAAKASGKGRVFVHGDPEKSGIQTGRESLPV